MHESHRHDHNVMHVNEFIYIVELFAQLLLAFNLRVGAGRGCGTSCAFAKERRYVLSLSVDAEDAGEAQKWR